jgi:hypothetical protein
VEGVCGSCLLTLEVSVSFTCLAAEMPQFLTPWDVESDIATRVEKPQDTLSRFFRMENSYDVFEKPGFLS